MRRAGVGVGVLVVASAFAAGFAGCNGFPTPLPGHVLSDYGGNEAVAAGDGGGSALGLAGLAPAFGQVMTQATPPPPISGGTLLATHDGTLAVVADADRDQLYVVDLATNTSTTIPLLAGDEPGRAVEDGLGRVHVALRGGGAVATIDLASREVVSRRSVCAAPRGIAYDAPSGLLYVACATGELVTLRAKGGPVVRSVIVDRDLRDVIVERTRSATGASKTVVYVSRLKTAELLTLSPEGVVLGRSLPATRADVMAPAVAYRTIAMQNGSVAMVHQRGTLGVVSTMPGGYGSGDGCNSSVVESTVTSFTAGAPQLAAGPIIPSMVLPVDVAESRDGRSMAVVAAGNAFVPGVPSVMVVPESSLFSSLPAPPPVPVPEADAGVPAGNCSGGQPVDITGQAVGAAYTQTTLLVQTRQPAALFVYDAASLGPPIATISLSSINRDDTGHDVFHSNSGAFIACASCHPEGHEDGRLWTFDDVGSRRTQSLGGTLQGTAPYHWEGDLSDVASLMVEVFQGRMSGPALSSDEVTALQNWIFSIPAPPASASSLAAVDAVARGRALFESAAVGCATCHSGAKFTNNATLDVATGGQFQVPSLIGVGWRSPFLHDGCAQTLADRFAAPCTDGRSHGLTADLDPGQISDLVAYLETL